MPRNYNPITGHELALAIDNQIRKALSSRPDLFGHHLTYRAFRFAVGISIDFLDGRGEGAVAHESLSTPEQAQGEFAQNLADPNLSGRVWVGVGFSHLLTLPPDQARADLHLPTREIVAEGGQMVEKEIPPSFDPLLDAPPETPSEEPVQAAQPQVAHHHLSEDEIAEMFEAPPSSPAPARVVTTPRVAAPAPPASPAPAAPAAQRSVPRLDPQRAAQLSAQARSNPQPSLNNPFDRSGPIETRDVQTLRPRPPHQGISERLNNES